MFADLGNGAPVIRGSANAAHAPAALVRAARIFGDSTYLDVALESGRAYYERFIAKGLTYGGPNEALMAPDSESAAMLLESLVTLAEETKSADWIRRARDAAHYLSSWVVSYPYAFPRDSEFGRLGINTTGAVFANCQNKHAAPGICTGSGDALYRLYRMTGDRAYFDLCREIAAFIPQTVSTDVRPIRARDGEGLMPSGWINERVNMSDWEGTDAVGTVFYGTCWCTAAFMCTCADLVGIEELDLKPKETQRQDSQIGKPKCHQNQTGKDTDK